MLCSLPLVSVISHLFVSYYLSFPITAAIEQKTERENDPASEFQANGDKSGTPSPTYGVMATSA